MSGPPQRGQRAVAQNFIGWATHKLDAKGRVSLPSTFRDVLRAQGSPDDFVLIPSTGMEGEDPSHLAMTPAGHAQLIAALSEEEYDSPEQEQATRLRYIGNARPISVEEGGRFVLSRDLREALGLTDQVHFVGDGGTFQLWHPETHAARHGPAAAVRPKRISLARIGQ